MFLSSRTELNWQHHWHLRCFSHHKLLRLPQHLSQVNVVGIYLSHQLGWTRSHAKTSPCRAGSSNPWSKLWLDVVQYCSALHKQVLSVSFKCYDSHDKSFSQLYKGKCYSFIVYLTFCLQICHHTCKHTKDNYESVQWVIKEVIAMHFVEC